jgi:hypothetical protein
VQTFSLFRLQLASGKGFQLMQTLCMYKAMSTRLQPDRFCFPDVANQLDFECRYVRLDFPPLIKTFTTPQQAGRASFFYHSMA